MFKIFSKLVFSKNQDKLKKISILDAIQNFENKKNKNLLFLIRKRFEWIKKFVNKNEKGLEVGAGAGFSKKILNDYNLEICDYSDDDHLDFKNIDALKTNFNNESYDYIIACNMMHHVAFPINFLREMHRILKNKGKLIIFEPNVSIFYQLITYITKHEGFDFSYDIWNTKTPMTNPNDPWDSNQAAVHLLFDDEKKFLNNTNNLFSITYDKYSEFFTFINSGGIYSRSPYLALNEFFLKFIYLLDLILVKIAPSIFALGRKIVLEKKS